MASLDMSWGRGGWGFGEAKSDRPLWSAVGEGVVIYWGTFSGRGRCQPSPHPPSPAPTPSVALFPSSSTSNPHLPSTLPPLPPPVAPTLAPRPLFLSSRSPVRNRASGGPRCGSEDGPCCGKGRAPSFLHLPLSPSPAADPSPSAEDRVSAARTLATTSQSRLIRGDPVGEAGQRRALSSVLERVPDSPRPCLPAAASAMRGAGGAC